MQSSSNSNGFPEFSTCTTMRLGRTASVIRFWSSMARKVTDDSHASGWVNSNGNSARLESRSLCFVSTPHWDDWPLIVNTVRHPGRSCSSPLNHEAGVSCHAQSPWASNVCGVSLSNRISSADNRIGVFVLLCRKSSHFAASSGFGARRHLISAEN